jgi:outer membrane protein
MKNTALAIVLFLSVFGISANLENDTKIGYVYMELVLSNMPETQEMNKVLDKYNAEKSETLKKNTQFLNNKLQEMQRKEKAGELTEAGRIISENEINDLRASIEKQARVNEQELYQKRIELLTPIAKKLEKAMDEVAAKKGYKYVLNSSDGTGNSIVVVAPDADDLTRAVFDHLGIEIE